MGRNTRHGLHVKGSSSAAVSHDKLRHPGQQLMQWEPEMMQGCRLTSTIPVGVLSLAAGGGRPDLQDRTMQAAPCSGRGRC